MLKALFKEHRYQKAGASFFVAALITSCFDLVAVPIALLVIVGLIDLWLWYTKQETITKWVHRQFPRWGDMAVVIGILVLSWWLFGPAAFLPLCLGIVTGHLFWR